MVWKHIRRFSLHVADNYLMGANSNDAILAQLDNELEEETHEEHHRSVKNKEETTQGKLLGML